LSASRQPRNIGRFDFGRNNLKCGSAGGATSSRMMSLIMQFATRQGQAHFVLDMKE
jgi:hypothetical protein